MGRVHDCLSRMRRKSHVRFLGGREAARPSSHPTANVGSIPITRSNDAAVPSQGGAALLFPMKLAILSRNARLYSTRRLVEAARQRGHSVRVLDPLRCYLRISSDEIGRAHV